MSCSDWEQGTIKIPSSEWKSFKAKILDTVNKINKRDYSLSLSLYAQIIDEGKEERAFDYKKALILAMTEYNLSYDSSWKIEKSMFSYFTSRSKPLKPKKKNFPDATNRTSTISLNGDAEIEFNNTMKTVRWSIPEENHAVNEAHGHVIAKTMFLALDNINWKRNSGGIITGNDEHNKDSLEIGDGGNYISYVYGPIGSKYAGSTEKKISKEHFHVKEIL